MSLDAHSPAADHDDRPVEVSFLLPVYNEEWQLREKVDVLHRFLSEKADYAFEILICDDGSTDQTAQIASRLASQYAGTVRYVCYETNRGRGYALKFAEKYLRGPKVIYLDLDMCKDAYLEEIAAPMVERLNTYDIVIASRFMKASHVSRKPVRGVVSVIYRFIVRLVFPGLRIADTDVGFKGIRKDVFSDLNKTATLNRWSYDLQLLVLARELSYTIVEFPLHWNERLDPHSTVNIVGDSFEQLHGILYTKMAQIRRRFHPAAGARAAGGAAGTESSRRDGVAHR